MGINTSDAAVFVGGSEGTIKTGNAGSLAIAGLAKMQAAAVALSSFTIGLDEIAICTSFTFILVNAAETVSIASLADFNASSGLCEVKACVTFLAIAIIFAIKTIDFGAS